MTFDVAITADFYHADGQPKYNDFGLDVFEQSSQINHRPFTSHESKIAPQQLQGVNGVLVLTPRVDIESLADAGELLIVSRFGVGYDSVDVDACTGRCVSDHNNGSGGSSSRRGDDRLDVSVKSQRNAKRPIGQGWTVGRSQWIYGF